MKKETKEEIKEIGHIFGITILSGFLVAQCNSLLGNNVFSKPTCTKQEEKTIKPDSARVKDNLVYENLLHEYMVKSR